ncbi:MAG: hypothetical protein ACQXXD_06000 [Thermoplasmatota archaeon]|jgi:aspartyl aminopeptidase
MVEEESKYAYKKKSAWELLSKEQIKEAFDFAEEYKKFLDHSKTERETIQEIKEKAVYCNKKKNCIEQGKRGSCYCPR